MLGIGPEELMLVALLALLVLGPERLPKVMRDLGRFVGDMRRTSDDLRQEFLNADKILEASATSSPAKSASSKGGDNTAPGAASAPAEPVSSGPPGETAFDREMREARERLKGR
jgi:Tat protein translocase TatB subunit